jgi:hypothetical protein
MTASLLACGPLVFSLLIRLYQIIPKESIEVSNFIEFFRARPEVNPATVEKVDMMI